MVKNRRILVPKGETKETSSSKLTEHKNLQDGQLYGAVHIPPPTPPSQPSKQTPAKGKTADK